MNLLQTSNLRAGGRNVDDTAPTNRLHVRQTDLRDNERPFGVDFEHTILILIRQILERNKVGDTGIINNNGHWTKSHAQLGNGSAHAGMIYDAGLWGDGLATFANDLIHHGLAILKIQVEHADRLALAG